MAGEIRLWQRAEITLDGETHVLGSLRSPQTITATNTELINKTVNVGTAAVKVWELADMPASSTADVGATFFWIENVGPTNFVWVQVTASQADGDDFMVFKLDVDEKIVFMNGGAQKDPVLDALAGTADYIEEIWALADTAAIDLKVVVAG